MTAATIIDGKGMAAGLIEELRRDARRFRASAGIPPALTVVLVGNDPGSAVYVRNKARTADAIGFRSSTVVLACETTERALLAVIAALNDDLTVHGILIQLPLPPHIEERVVTRAVSPAKDIDGFHPVNAGLVASGELDLALVPCTPAGVVHMLIETLGDLAGRNALVIGRSNIVGKPLASLLIAHSCTVTVGHSRTRDLPDVARRVDIIIAAVGSPGLVRGDWIAPGATVIDVGINRVGDTNRLVGDVAFDEACAVAGAITPVPGGVGPMTIAMLMANTLTAACRQHGIDRSRVRDSVRVEAA